MKCRRCQHENRPGAKFCDECGTPLAGTAHEKPYAELKAENELLGHSLSEALQQQTATSGILRVISSSPTDIQPVFDAIAASAVRLCGARIATVFRFDGELIHLIAHHGYTPEALELPRGLFPAPPHAGSVTGRAIMNRAVVHIEDALADGTYPYQDFARAAEVRSVIAVPLLRDRCPVGAITASRAEPGAFTERQIELLKTFADQAVIAIENVRLFKELEGRNEDLTEALEHQTATSEILSVIATSPTDLKRVLDALAQSAARFCAAYDAGIWRLEGDVLRLVGHHGPIPTHPVGRTIPATRGTVVGRSAVDRQTVQVADLQAESEEFPEGSRFALELGHRTLLSVPLVREDIVIGAIGLRRTEVQLFSDKQVALLKSFADQAVIAIENVRLFRELEARNRDLTESLERQTATSEILQVISGSPTDVQPVLEIVAQNAARLCGASDAIIRRVEGNAMLPAAHFGSMPMSSASVARPITRASIAGRAILERKTIHLYNLPDPEFAREYPEGAVVQQCEGYRTIVVTPLLREGAAIGMIAIRRMDARPFTDKQIVLLRTFADQAVIAIENVRLFKELQERTNDLESKSLELEVASQHKSEFLANMSHELRTPLNAIIGFSEVLSDRLFGELNEKQDEYLKDIHASGQHLLSLINDILDLSKIEAGRMELELTDFDLPTAIDNALTLVRERAGRRSIALHQAADARLGQIWGDERKIKQVLLNLLSNAIKFTPDGGWIDVRARPVDGSVEVSVSDTGVGVAPEDQEAIFEEFRQVGTADKKVEGTGLGLALSRKFIELHGGRIWVESQVGTGSTFTFSIPVRRGE
jgi:signal transduction histidine kinase/putative methionine-R-sulfoxide reductase with GAF domain